jgi:recombinational DNA repair protein (RecF pathway)
MSYHIYTTDGIVLKRNNFGESNSLFFILTVDLGLIMASAQAVRMSNSKLCSVSCVKGKNGWKITNATAKENFFFGRPIFVQKLVSQISVVLLRMMPGEQKHQEVFSVVLAGFSALKNVDEKNLDNTGSFEILMMLRILYHLGYVEKNSQSQTENFLQDDLDWNEKILSEVAVAKIELIKLINKGLEESQL